MPDISVIIPVYNVAQYLSKAIDSVLLQDGVDFEIILVNDGSTDNSLEICKDYCKKDSRIKLIDKENKGLGFARNSRMEIAKGEYFFLVLD